MRVCIVYDCLFPWTVGGAERWYRNLGERLASAGHEVTYLTMRQWERDAPPAIEGVRVVAVTPRMGLYRDEGQRRILPPLVFGLGVLWHLLRHARHYDVVHSASFPYFSLLAIGLLRRAGRYGVVVDWHELWSREYWSEYLGAVGGRVGWTVQALCARIPQRAFCFARMTAARLRGVGLRGDVTVLEGEYVLPETPHVAQPAGDAVVFAGRHIPEKRPAALVDAMAELRDSGLRAVIFGDGPERPHVLARIAEAEVADIVDAPGFVATERIEHDLPRAVAMVLPSRREGYGMIVVEAASYGVPSVVVEHPDNAAVELVEDGVNGVVAPSADPEALAAAILRVRDGGPALRASTIEWFAANARRLSLEGSLERVVEAYSTRS